MKKNLLTSIFIVLFAFPLFADNESTTPSKFKFDFYGFVRNDFTYDSRKNLSAISDLVSFMPLEPDYNAFGEDLNAIPNTRFLAISTRLGINISGPSVLGAKSFAKIETDFCGFSASTTMLRIRQAYIALNWEHQQLLLGQTWHPMSGNLMPDVLSLNAGAPFNAFNRSPMIRYKANYKSLEFTGAAIWQFQYASVGPIGASDSYMSNSMVPELFLGIDYQHEGLKIGIGAEYVHLRPRVKGAMSYQDSLTTTIKVKDVLNSVNAMLCLSYNKDAFYLKAKSIYGQNSSHLLNMTGYGITQYNSDGSYGYAPLQSSSTWLSLAYIRKYKLALLGGYMKNLGSSKEFVSIDDIYVRGSKNIDQMFRVSPSFSYSWNKLEAGIEYEMTGVMYGTPSLYGNVNHGELTINNRVTAVVVYVF